MYYLVPYPANEGTSFQNLRELDNYEKFQDHPHQKVEIYFFILFRPETRSAFSCSRGIEASNASSLEQRT